VGISAFGSMLTGGVSAFPRNAVGFIHALERNLIQQNLTFGPNRRVAIGVENYMFHKGEKNHTSPKMALSKPWQTHGEIANSVLDSEWKCNATITLLVLSSGILDIDALRAALTETIPRMRFANGSIFVKTGFAEVFHGNDPETLINAVKSVKASRSSFLTSREDLIGEGDEFNSFVNALALFDMNADTETPEANSHEEDDESEKTTVNWKRQQSGWIVPVERGYQTVTNPVKGRPASRHADIPTIIVTPVIGLGEFVSSKRVTSDLDLKSFWKSKSEPDAGFYLFNATSFN
jgi:CRISPR type I-F-associated protein Csy2